MSGFDKETDEESFSLNNIMEKRLDQTEGYQTGFLLKTFLLKVVH